MTRQAIASQHDSGRSLQLSGESLVNLYGEPGPEMGRSKLPLYGAPNAKHFVQNLGSGPVRATLEALGFAWVLSGSTVYYIDSAGTATAAAGASVDPLGWACMDSDGQTITITANNNGYVVSGVAATVTLTLSGNAVDGETVNIGGTIYTWRTSITATAYDVMIGTTASASIDNLIAAINRLGFAGGVYSDSTLRHTSVSAAAGAGDTMTVTALEPGTAGNSIATTETMTNGSFGSATLTGGASWTVNAITDPDFAGASSVAFLDGFMVMSRPNSGVIFISDQYNASAYDALDFTSAEASPDELVRVIVDHRELLAIGKRTIEPFRNVGAADFPFQRVEGGLMERGCIAPASVAKMDNSVFFVGDDRIVYRLQGYTPARISSSSLEEALRLATVAEAEAAEAWTYALAGHHVYVLTFGQQTWCFDAMTNLWHQRRSGTGQTGRWRCQWGVQAFGKMLVGDSLAGNLGELDLDTYTDFGATRRCSARTPNMYADGMRARMHMIELEAEMGVGISTGQGSDPLVMMRTSDDGGKTWSPERTAKLGKIGETKNRARWMRNGSFRQRMVEFAVSDPVKPVLYGWRHETEGGAS